MFRTVANPAKFFSHNPTRLKTVWGYAIWEHPTLGDDAPLYMSTPNGILINTGCYDVEDFSLEVCREIESERDQA